MRQWTVLVDAAPLGKGHCLALPISAADGLETWPLSAEEHPGVPPLSSMPVIKTPVSRVSRGLEGHATWMGGGSAFPSVLFVNVVPCTVL